MNFIKWLEGFFLDDKGSKSMSRLGHFVSIVSIAVGAVILGLFVIFAAKGTALFVLLIKMLGGGGGGGYAVGKIADAFGGESANNIQDQSLNPEANDVE